MLPDGLIVLAAVIAATTSSGDMLYARSRSGFRLTTMRARAAAERRRRRDAGQRREQRAHQFNAASCISPTVLRFAGKHEVANRHAAGVEPHDERRHRSGRHERARAIHIRNGFGHRLRHVRARMKLQLDERRALDRLRFDVLDAGDVEEVILVIVGEVTLHLRRVHAAVRLRDVDRGNAERRKNIARHLSQGQHTSKTDAQNNHQSGDRATHRGGNEVHFALIDTSDTQKVTNAN